MALEIRLEEARMHEVLEADPEGDLGNCQSEDEEERFLDETEQDTISCFGLCISQCTIVFKSYSILMFLNLS